MECPLWSLQVEEAGDGGGGMSGLNVSLGLGSSLFSARTSLSNNTTLGIVRTRVDINQPQISAKRLVLYTQVPIFNT